MSLIKLTSVLLLGFGLAVPGSALAQATETTNSVPGEAPEPSAAPSRYFVFRLAVLGAHRAIYDLSAFGAGAELTLGGEGEIHGGYYNLRVIRGETKAGLTVTEASVLGSYEFRISSVRFGVGGGPTLLNITRITDGGSMAGWGLALFGRIGYDFGERTGPYVLGQVEVQTQHSWGPTLYVGYRL